MTDSNPIRADAREVFEHLPHHVDADGFFHVDGIVVAYVGDPEGVYVSTSGYVELTAKHGLLVAGGVFTEAHFLSMEVERSVQ